jgi:CRP-like cAMP-binding protein
VGPLFETALARKLNTFTALSPDELRCLAEMQAHQLAVKRNRQLTREGQTGQKVFVLQEGWACSFKDLPNGARQIISFPIAGDCVGLRSVLLRTADHSFVTLTNAVVSEVESDLFLKCVTEFPRLGVALLWSASRDEAMVVEHLVSVGRRDAIARMAHFFMELAERLSLVGHATEIEFKCPLTQFVIADALGLSSIHVNRVLRQLRERKLLTFRSGLVEIHNLNGLQKIAGFEGGYLYSRS